MPLALLLGAALALGAGHPDAEEFLEAPPPTDLEVARALAALGAGEPDVGAVQAAAAQAAEAGAPPASGFARRARMAALLPRVTAEYRQDERSYRVVGLQGSGEVDYLRLAPGTAFAVRATWDLGALVAAPGELAAAAEAAARARRREEAVKRATELFYERRRLRLELLVAPRATALDRARAELEVERLGAELDALTGGLLTRGTP
ncbi:MAG TPA: hypothetical protein VM753_00620 [Anaeromyxobacter sp.]|nr:hypothetical protein [Anaeromyxobacter sp.]